jgi:hypothetical protein
MSLSLLIFLYIEDRGLRIGLVIWFELRIPIKAVGKSIRTFEGMCFFYNKGEKEAHGVIKNKIMLHSVEVELRLDSMTFCSMKDLHPFYIFYCHYGPI